MFLVMVVMNVGHPGVIKAQLKRAVDAEASKIELSMLMIYHWRGVSVTRRQGRCRMTYCEERMIVEFPKR